jgi:signal peptidase II
MTETEPIVVRLRPRPQWGLASAIVVALVIADQITKTWALNRLDAGRVIDVVWTLRFNLAFNTGMAFSRGPGLGPIIGVVSVIVVAVLVVSIRRSASTLRTVASASVIGGALGNIIDRLFRGEGWMRGAVVDFIDLQWWPIFNIADIAIVLGGVALVVAMSRRAPA